MASVMSSNQASVNPLKFDRFSRLKALQPVAKRSESADPNATAASTADRDSPPHTDSPSDRLASLLGATITRNEHGEHMSVVTSHTGCEPCNPSALALELLLREAPAAIANPEQWLFLDTETTGLSGGTGTYPFLIGLAWWEANGLKIEQLFMREYSEERSMLAALAQRMERRAVLVTFNGKSFDWPLLETRFRMTRTISSPAPRAHLDFLHPARNLWRLKLGTVKLAHLEHHVLGTDREQDLISGDIPKIYTDFVRSGHAEPLVPVFLHNQMDLHGLARIANHTISILGNESTTMQDGLELFGLSRMCERRGQLERAMKSYEQSIGSQLPSQTSRAARAALARLAKRNGNIERACELWESLLGNSSEGYEAYEQLAIFYEHEVSDVSRALDLTGQALAQLRHARQVKLIGDATYQKIKARFEHRRTRLERKAEPPLSLFAERSVRGPDHQER